MTVGTDQRALDELCVNTIRTLSMDAVQQANSGHPGTPMALAPIAYLLYTRIMRHAPEAPDWPGRDRFVLSCGHASMLLYSTLYLTGYDVTLDQIKRFRQLDSPCAGHPEYGHVPGVETTTGPLGQGISTAVGMALGERMLAARFDHAGPGADLALHLLHRLRRRHGGGHPVRGVVAGRPPRARQADRLLRRQPHLDRGRHQARLLRGRRRALRGLRLARAEPARGPRARRARGGGAQRARRRRPPEPDHRPHPHRARLAEQAGHPRRPWLTAG